MPDRPSQCLLLFLLFVLAFLFLSKQLFRSLFFLPFPLFLLIYFTFFTNLSASSSSSFSSSSSSPLRSLLYAVVSLDGLLVFSLILLPGLLPPPLPTRFLLFTCFLLLLFQFPFFLLLFLLFPLFSSYSYCYHHQN